MIDRGESRLGAAFRAARQRAAGALPGSPDWEAAMAALDDLEQIAREPRRVERLTNRPSEPTEAPDDGQP